MWCIPAAPTVPLAREHQSDFSLLTTICGDVNLATSLLREVTAGLLCFSNLEVDFGMKVCLPREVLLLSRLALICVTNEKASSLAVGA